MKFGWVPLNVLTNPNCFASDWAENLPAKNWSHLLAGFGHLESDFLWFIFTKTIPNHNNQTSWKKLVQIYSHHLNWKTLVSFYKSIPIQTIDIISHQHFATCRCGGFIDHLSKCWLIPTELFKKHPGSEETYKIIQWAWFCFKTWSGKHMINNDKYILINDYALLINT